MYAARPSAPSSWPSFRSWSTPFADRPNATGASKASEIADKLRTGIASGELPAGHRLAGANALGKLFGCTGKPAEAARIKLIKEGLVVKRDGHYFVSGSAQAAEARLDRAFDELAEPPKPDLTGELKSLLEE